LEKNPAPPTLAELQSWLRWIITEPRGVAAALAAPAGEPAPRCLGAIVDAPPLDRAERLDVYAEAYFARLAETLGKDFPAIRAALGETDFHRLCARYLKQHPSRSFTVSDAGRALPGFLAAGDAETARLPWLADLAALEWAVLEAFFTDRAPALDPARLAEIPPEAWAEARLRLDPTCRLLAVRWAVDGTWRTGAEPAREAAHLLVHRAGGCVTVERLEPAAARLLGLVAEGLPLGRAINALDAEGAERDFPPVNEWFQDWVRAGVIREVEWPS
jgi:hypothetical protein